MLALMYSFAYAILDRVAFRGRGADKLENGLGTMSGDVILATNGLSVHFGEVAAVNKLDAAVLEGQIHGLIGPNGARKTTLTDAVSGLILPTAGRYKI